MFATQMDACLHLRVRVVCEYGVTHCSKGCHRAREVNERMQCASLWQAVVCVTGTTLPRPRAGQPLCSDGTRPRTCTSAQNAARLSGPWRAAGS